MKRFIVMSALLGILCLLHPAGVRASEPASVVPQDAVLYLELGKEAAQDLLGMAALPPAAGIFAPAMQSPFAYADQGLNLPAKDVENAAPHLGSVGFALEQNTPILVLSFDEDRWPAALLQGVPKAPDGTSALFGGPVAAISRNGFLIVSAPQVCARLARGDYATLASDAAFKAAVGASPVLAGPPPAGKAPVWAYVAVPAVLQAARESMPLDRAAELDAFCRASGLDHAQYAVVAGRGPGQDRTAGLTALLQFQGEDALLLRLVPEGPLEVSADVPADAAAAFVLSWKDAKAFFGGIRDLALQVNEVGGDRTMRARFAEIEKNLGLSLDQLLAQVGSGGVIYLPEAVPNGLMESADWTAAVRLSDSKGFEASLSKLSMYSVGQQPAATTYEGVAMSQIPGVPVFYKVLPDRVVLGGSAAAVKKHLDWHAAPARKSLQLGAAHGGAAALAWADLGLLLKSYPAARSGTKLVLTLGRERTGLAMTASVEDLDVQQLGQASLVAYPAMMAAMLMPAIARARTAARESGGRANLHDIGLGIAMYREGNNDDYPPDLEPLLDKGFLESPEVFVDPADKAPVQRGAAGFRYSYEYVGTVPAAVPGNVIMAYSRRGIYPAGRNVLCADVAVLWVSEAELHNPNGNPRTSLRASYEAVVKAFGDKLTDERKAELKKFYEVGG